MSGSTSLSNIESNSPKFETLPTDYVDLLGQLSKHISHRLRSPMGAVTGYSDLLCASSDPDKMQLYSEKIIDSVHELNTILSEIELVNVIKTVSKGQYKVEEVISKVQSGFSASEAERIQWSGSALESLIQTDILLLQRVLSELIRNALQMARPADAPVQIRWNSHHIRVSNPGDAIPESVVERIFLPFSGTNPLKMGLGLTISHYFCSLMGYTLDLITNSDEEGVAFEIGLCTR